ncbi:MULTISPECIES: DUF3833 family protein [unclassified Rhizobium]|uniref:DUF3833 family protein n=1 Tax=unclassified Rhizobium TaxID=2613769 RepID=UPI0006F82756|nr:MULTISPECIES: DUF3833 family protein [unclassified Rhizobium]KQV38890.1 hypothetical protein ASC86_23500 [Rhizobium sp. Root1212]KRD34958.1 hypothetical protein ASE37_22070 [Rhizobium sp. Root268]
MNIEDFADKTPTFVLEEFFSGDLKGWGTTLRRMGGLQNRFSIDAQGVWDPSANVLSLKEMYTFDDGHSDVLTWTIIKRDEGKYEGRQRVSVAISARSSVGQWFEDQVRLQRLVFPS